MEFIPGGWYLSGAMPSEKETLSESSEVTAQQVELPGFYIDRYEYNNTKGQAPVAGVSHARAAELCADQGKRLCTAQEWEKACKGWKNSIYSYGDSFDPEVCGPDINAAYNSGDRTLCRSDYAVYDMSGGFQEWTATPSSEGEGRYLVKGGVRGEWSGDASVEQRLRVERGYRCAYTIDRANAAPSGQLSFRCCQSPPDAGAAEGDAQE